MKENRLNDILLFRRMIIPHLIHVVFWIGAAASVISGVALIIVGISKPFIGWGATWIGVCVLVFGPLVIRLWCELLILCVHINEALTYLCNSLKSSGSQVSSNRSGG